MQNHQSLQVEMVVEQFPCPEKGGVKLVLELRLPTNPDNGGLDARLEFPLPFFGEDLNSSWGRYEAGCPPHRSRKMVIYLPPDQVHSFLDCFWSSQITLLKKIISLKESQSHLQKTIYFQADLTQEGGI